jgi:hypothetical protein
MPPVSAARSSKFGRNSVTFLLTGAGETPRCLRSKGAELGMAVIQYDLLANPENAYSEFRYGLFTELFGTHFQPYVDDDGRPRIGAAIDLVTFMPSAASAILGGFLGTSLLNQLQAVVNLPYSAGDSALLRSRLDQVLQNFGGRPTGMPTVFEFTTDAQAKSVLSDALSSIESSLGSANNVGIPLSQERAVVASLAHEGYGVGNILNDMTLDLDRTEPWFEMRYINGERPTDEAAAARFYQSAIFELYNDPGNVGADEAKDVGRAYTAHRATALAYEDAFDPQAIGMGAVQLGGREQISSILQPAIAAIAAHYFAEVAHADELLFVSADGGTLKGDDAADGFNSAKNDEDLMVGSAVADTMSGGVAGDVLLGLAGNDRLTGDAGNDNLYGGEGADTLLGGSGNDKLWGGGGGDLLKGGKGKDTYILGGNDERDPDNGGNPGIVGAANTDRIVEARRGGIDTVIAQVDGGSLNLRNVEKFRLDADVSGNLTVNLNEFDAFVLSGGNDEITLVINRLQKTPIDIKTGDGADVVHIEFEKGVDPSQVLNGKGLTARFQFTDLTDDDTIDLRSIGIRDIFTERSRIDDDTGFYLLAPGVKLDIMDGKRIDKTYNNYTDNWFVVKCGDDTPFGPEFIGNIDRTHFDI